MIDALLAARHSASSSSGIRKMTAQDWAMHTACDLWTRKISNEPRSEIAVPRQSVHTNTAGSPVVVCGDVGQAGSLTFEEARKLHRIKRTKQLDSRGGKVRRVCAMQADEHCKGTCTFECFNVACMAKVNLTKNRWGSTVGTFVCDNGACEDKHHRQIVEQSTAHDFSIR